MALVTPAAIIHALRAGHPLPGKAARRDPAWPSELAHPDALAWLDQVLPLVAPVRAAEALDLVAQSAQGPTWRAFHRLLAHLDPVPRRPEQETALSLTFMRLIRAPLTATSELQPGRGEALIAALNARDPDDPLVHLRVGLALREALDSGSFDAVYPLVRTVWAPKPSETPLLATVLERAEVNQPIGTALDLLPDTLPEAGGRLLMEALLQDNEFVRRSLKDDRYRWPLDLGDVFRPPKGADSLSTFPIQDQDHWKLQQLQRTLERSDLSDDLKDRVLEACRPLRPQVGEARFQAKDRALALAQRPVTSSRSRRRS